MDPIAVYGATVATAAIAWQVFTWWRKGARLRGHAAPDMRIFGSVYDSSKYIALEVVNTGDSPTTITNVSFEGFPNLLARFRGKPTRCCVVNQHFGCDMPYTLSPGGRFTLQVVQTPVIEDWSRATRLYVGVSHSMRRSSLFLRLRPIAETAEESPSGAYSAAA